MMFMTSTYPKIKSNVRNPRRTTWLDNHRWSCDSLNMMMVMMNNCWGHHRWRHMCHCRCCMSCHTLNGSFRMNLVCSCCDLSCHCWAACCYRVMTNRRMMVLNSLNQIMWALLSSRFSLWANDKTCYYCWEYSHIFLIR